MRDIQCWAVLAALFLLVAVEETQAAREARVVTKEGKTLRGQVVADEPEQITLRIAGIPSTIKRENIARVEYIKTPAAEYRQRKADLDPQDADGFYALMKWLVEKQKLYDLAAAELDQLERNFPNDSRFGLLKTVAREHAEHQRKTEARGKDRSKRTVEKVEKDPKPTTEEKRKKLLPDQINRIKVYEINLNARPRVVVPRDVIDEVLEKYASDPRTPKGREGQQSARRAAGLEQLRLLFRLSEGNESVRDYYSRVTVSGDPPVLRTFRSAIHRNYVLNYCATNKCHGGENAGKFALFRSRATSDETVYTNFFILHRTRTEHGHMIDRDAPDRSLLIQYGMNRDEASTPHPEVPGWKAKIFNPRHADYVRLVRWIESLWVPSPRYGITYPQKPEAGPVPTATDKQEAKGQAPVTPSPPSIPPVGR